MISRGVTFVVPNGPLEEAPGGPRVPPCGHEHVNNLVERAVDIAPLAGDVGIGLFDLSASPDGLSAGSGSLGQLQREPLHAAVDDDVVDLVPRSASNSSTSR
jgi:hypothetical protein